MEEHQDDRTDNAPEQSFEELLAQSLAGSPRLEPGDKVEATVLQIGAEWVFLDVGQKGEGVLDIKELLDADGKLTVARGDTVHAYFLGREDDELLFTTRMGGGASGTAQLEQAWASGIPVEGRLELEIKGGYEVKLAGGVRAFCPFSQLGLRRQENPEEAARPEPGLQDHQVRGEGPHDRRLPPRDPRGGAAPAARGPPEDAQGGDDRAGNGDEHPEIRRVHRHRRARGAAADLGGRLGPHRGSRRRAAGRAGGRRGRHESATGRRTASPSACAPRSRIPGPRSGRSTREVRPTPARWRD